MKFAPLALSSFVIVGALAPSNLIAEDDWFNFYGKINLAYDKTETPSSTEQGWELNSYASRVGIKGNGALGENFEAFYHIEWQVDATFDSKDNITDRNQIVGIKGTYGEVFFGRHDTPTKAAQYKIDLFSDLPGDLKNSLNGEKRAAEIVQYASPLLGNSFRVKTAIITDNGSTDNNSVSTSLGYENGNLLMAVAYDSDVEKANLETLRLTSQYKLADWQFGLIYQSTNYNDKSGSGFLASAKYKFGSNTLKVQLIESDIWKTGVSSKVKYSSQFSLGYERKLANKLSGYAYLTSAKNGGNHGNDDTFGLGIVYKFSI